MHQWRKGIACWKCGKTLYISVPFTWLMDEAEKLGKGETHWSVDGRGKKQYHNGPYVIGGPGTMKPTECEGFEPILFHNPCATFTTRGCPNKCEFCAVPKLEGDFREIKNFRPAPIVCDNNLLTASRSHLERVVDSLKVFKEVDFNQGLEAGRFTPEVADLFGNLKCKVRFAFDWVGVESKVADAVKLCNERTTKNIGVYVLIGFKDTPEDALYRLETVRKTWKIRPNPMRYQPLDAKKKDEYIAPGWTEEELRKMMKFYSSLAYLDDDLKYEDYDYKVHREEKDDQLCISF